MINSVVSNANTTIDSIIKPRIVIFLHTLSANGVKSEKTVKGKYHETGLKEK